MSSPCCLSAPPPIVFVFFCSPCRIKEAYEITLQTVCLWVLPIFFILSAVRVVSKESRRLVLPRTYLSNLIIQSSDKYVIIFALCVSFNAASAI
jgi:hypothetical protein